MDENIFSGIPALDDVQGLEQFASEQQADNFGFNTQVPAALQTNEPEQTAQQEPAPQQAPQAPVFTSEQVAQIVAKLNQTNQPQQTASQYRQPAQATPQQTTYTPRQVEIIQQLVARGVPLDRIQAALNGNRQTDSAQKQILDRIQGVENYLQRQQYQAEESAFIEKMTSFGDKFGLSEADLVTFGNQALSMGINLANVTDVEAVFRAVYPQQYAIRSQRIAGAAAPQIYGGASAAETPRATSSKLEDAYVDAFLKQAMPNAYGMHKN